eukprot:Hpha_TRINITY_DN33580_c0_g1::TRINITY_DN33580_c0_g1_i1::g.170986::m.170986
MRLDDGSTDLVFDIGGREIGCHREVLSARCEYLRDYLRAQPECVRVYVSNAPYEATRVALLHLYAPSTPLRDLIPEASGWADVVKIWEVGLRFGLTDLGERCTELLRRQTNSGNVCQLLATLFKYPVSGESSALFKRHCLEYIAQHHQTVSATKDYADLTETPRIRREIDTALRRSKRQPSAKEHRGGVPVVAADLAAGSRRSSSTLSRRQPLYERSASNPVVQGYDGEGVHRDDMMGDVASRRSRTVSQPPQPLPSLPTRRHGKTPDPQADSQPPSAPSSPRSSHHGTDVAEPVYEAGPIFRRPKPAPDEPPTSAAPRPTPAPDPGPVGVRRALATPPGTPAATPVSLPQVAAGAVCVRLAVCQHVSAPPPSDGWRLATAREAQAQHDELLDLMGELDGGYLGSFALADGKVDGPGFGVPLRFVAGEQYADHCGFRVEAREEVAEGPLPVPAPQPRPQHHTPAVQHQTP